MTLKFEESINKNYSNSVFMFHLVAVDNTKQ